jgi:hypothetical protein
MAREARPAERALHLVAAMQLILDRDQTEIVREILESALTELRLESSRTDTHAYREKLHHRENAVEEVLDQLDGPDQDLATVISE